MKKFEFSSSHELLGSWWISGSEERRMKGTLYLNPNGMYLEVIGEEREVSWLIGYKSQKEGPINGILFDGSKVTLTDAFAGSGSWGVLEKQSIIINTCIIGTHFKCDADIYFDEVVVYLSDFEEWLRFFPIKTLRRLKSHNEVAKCQVVDKLFEYEIPSLDGTITTAHNYRFGIGPTNTLSWQHVSGIRIKTNSKITKEKVSYYYISLSQLFSILMGNPVVAVAIDGLVNDDGPSICNIYRCMFDKIKLDNKHFHMLDVLADYGSIKSKLNFIFEKWFSTYENNISIHNLFYNRFVESRRMSIDHFLSYIQAIEIYSRIHCHKTLLPSGSFNNIKNVLINALPKRISRKVREELVNRINIMNQVSLRQRIKLLIRSLPIKVASAFKFNDEYIARLVRTRNYFIHYSETNRSRIFREDEIFRATVKLKALLLILQLKELGISPLKVLSKLKGRSDYNHIFLE